MQKTKLIFKYLIIVCVTMITAVIDLVTKEIAFNFLDSKGTISLEVTNFFNLVKVLNHGVSFGMFQNPEYGKYIFPVLTLLISVYLLSYIRKEIHWLYSLSVGMVIGGGLGNSIDRVINGSVKDFLDFHAFGYHWPAFNYADISICVGIFLLLLLDTTIIKHKSVTS